jgi:diguanylate cyclase (GGDEF)-like protein
MSEPDRLPADPPDAPDGKTSRESAIRSVVESLLERDAPEPDSEGSPHVSGAWSPAVMVEPDRPSRVVLVCKSARRCDALGERIAVLGCELVPRPDVDTAVAEIVDAPPAVVVAPWHGRDRWGRSVIEAIEHALPGHGIPVIARCRTRRAARAAIEAGAVDAIVWPYDAVLVSARVGAAIAAARNERHLRELRQELRSFREADRKGRAREEKVRPVEDVEPDSLTGLPRRSALVRALQGALSAGASARRRVALIVLDIDRFRNINRSLGRARGNIVLQEFAQRLVHASSPDSWGSAGGAGPISTMAARLAGDEFAVLISGISPGIDVAALLHQIRQDLSEDYDLPGGDRVHLTASIGVAVAPDDGVNGRDLMQFADVAVGEAAESGGGAIRFYGTTSNPWTVRHARMANLVVGALARGELTLHYQPIVAASSGRVVAAESLLRWNSPELGLVSPGEFVPIAEERGLMGRVGEWVLEESCKRLQAWIAEGVTPIRMAVNVSIGQLVQGKFPETVRTILERHDLRPELLELELSERGVLRDDPTVMDQLHQLRDMGCRLAIDDFGTGNSAVAYLKRFPLTTLKIDRSFVSGVGTSEEDSVITTTIAAMARQLDLNVVAEGVETVEQRRFLERCECAELQGFLFSPAVEASRFRSFLDDHPDAEPPFDR